MIYIIIAGITSLFLIPFINRIVPLLTGLILSALPIFTFIYQLSFFNEIHSGNTVYKTYPWFQSLSIELSFFLDGLSLFFSLLISLFGIIICIYSNEYMHKSKLKGRFYIYLMLFMTSMQGLVLAGNLISLYIFWELTSISSYLLISYDLKNQQSKYSGLQALLVTVSGGFALLAAFILIYGISDNMSFPELLNFKLASNGSFNSIACLLLLSVFTKSAQFPFHFWLPNAMTAPSPVSAYLHSATMVKAGIYLVARFTPIMEGGKLWNDLLLYIGGLTLLWGAIQVFKENDIKRILAYTTISGLGLIIFMMGIGTQLALQAAFMFLLAHAMYKCSLFLVAGNIDHATGTRDINELSGLYRHMPYTATIAILSCISMAGIIPFIGFLSKEVLYKAVLENQKYSSLAVIIILLASAIYVYVALLIAVKIFLGKQRQHLKGIKEAHYYMTISALLLSIFGLLGGLFYNGVPGPLINMAINSTTKLNNNFEVKLWHGLNYELILSFVTIILGSLLFLYHDKIITMRIRGLKYNFFDIIYNKLLKGILNTAYYITKRTQNGNLNFYLITIISFFLIITIFDIVVNNLTPDKKLIISSITNFKLYELIICLIIFSVTIKSVFSKSPLPALIALGLAGYSLALIFILFSAPDISITQLLIESMTVILFVIVLPSLPPFNVSVKKYILVINSFISLLFGVVITYIILLFINNPTHKSLRYLFSEYAFNKAHGKNIVNVIIVDFRALDTLGECVVLGVGAMGISIILKDFISKKEL